MKFPFEFGTKLIFRLILPGAILAAALAPAVHGLMHLAGIWIRLLFTYPFEVIAWGWLIVICDMHIHMLFEGRRYWPDGLRNWMIRREKARLQKLENVDYDTNPNSRVALEAGVKLAQYPID
jgi:hypothetical protein